MAAQKRYIEANTIYEHELPYSEVCMHMRVAGRRMGVKWDGKLMAQLYKLESFGISPATNHEIKNWVPFSAPVTTGEAGIFEDADGHYILEDVEAAQ